MIQQAVEFIQSEIKKEVGSIAIGNIAEILAGNNLPQNNPDIIISLINIEENRISRNPQNFVKDTVKFIPKNPAIHLNLTLLFTSINAGYELGLKQIQKVIGFFQKNNIFDHSNYPVLDPNIEKLIPEMVSLNLEQLHQLWSMLGGKYHPSVVYRVRMITIDYEPENDKNKPLVKEIEAQYKVIDPIVKQ